MSTTHFMRRERAVMRNCDMCGRAYQAKRESSKFCGVNCRNRYGRMRSNPVQPRRQTVDPAPVSVDPVADNSLVKATRAELEAYGVAETMMGQQALRIAEQMCGFETAGGMAALSKELSRVMVEATRAAVIVDDPVDEVRAQREKKRAG